MTLLIVSTGLPSKRYPLHGIFAFDQARALAEQGVDVYFFSIDLRSIRRIRKWGYNESVIEGVKCFEYNLPVSPFAGLLEKIGKKVCERLFKRVFKDHPFPLIIHTHFAAEYGSYISQKYGIPLVITEHSSDVNIKSLPQKTILKIKRNYLQASTVIAVSSLLANNIFQIFGVKCKVVHNIINTSLFSKSNSIKHSSFTFVTTALLDERKRVHQLIPALKKCPEDVKLIIIGNGPDYPKIEKLIGEYGLSSRVDMKGLLSREEAAEIYSYCDCFVLPSSLETFGVVYVEAMASGLPVIATRCGGPEDFVTKDNGVLIDVDDEDQLLDAMCTMVDNRSNYSSEKIKYFACANFSPDVISKKIIELYSNILS